MKRGGRERGGTEGHCENLASSYTRLCFGVLLLMPLEMPDGVESYLSFGLIMK